MSRRRTFRPMPRSYREHVAAALGAVCGMLALSVAVVAILLPW